MRRPFESVSLCLLLVACDPAPPDVDAGEIDAGARLDGGSSDAGPLRDTGPDHDAGPERDAGPDHDAGPLGTDAGIDGGAQPGTPLFGPQRVEPTPLAEGTLFASPTGTGETCSEAAPCDIFEVVSQAMAGDVVFLRGGVYAIDRNLSFRGRGTDAAPTIFESYPGERAILDGSSQSPGDQIYIRVLGDPTHLRLFEVRRMANSGLSVRSSDHVLEGLEVHSNLLSGIHIHESYDTPVSNRNLIRDCVVYDNSGVGLHTPSYADGGNSDGISISSGLDNRVERVLVYANSDDGIDTWRSQDTYVGYSIIYGNGLGSGNGLGIKAGGLPPSRGSYIERCLSYGNSSAGFDYNSGVGVVFSRNTSWDNNRGYYGASDTRFEHNLAGEVERAHGGNGVFDDNSWERSGDVTFVSTDPGSPDFLVPTPGGGFEDIGAHSMP